MISKIKYDFQNQILIGCFCLSLLAGCMGSKMSGVKSGLMTNSQSVTMHYQRTLFDVFSDTYATTIDGESFKCRAVLIDTLTTTGNASGTTFSAYGSSTVNTTSYSSTATGRVKALLIGDRGSTLKCLMDYANKEGYTPSGGIGECIHSDGRKINFSW